MLSSYTHFSLKTTAKKKKKEKKSLKRNEQKSKRHNLKKKEGGGWFAIHLNGAGHVLKRHRPALHKAQTQDTTVLVLSPGHVQTGLGTSPAHWGRCGRGVSASSGLADI